jgi:DNA polymerase-3 subunit delta
MPTLSREELRKQLTNNEIAPVYLLFGAETFLRDQAAKFITEKVMKNQPLREFNNSVFSLNNEKIQYALSVAEQMPMIATHKVVKITDIKISEKNQPGKLKEDGEEILTRYLKSPADFTVLILVADEFDKRKRIAKTLLETAVAVEFAPFGDNELMGWARQELKKLSAHIDDKALFHLVALIGSDVRTLTTEINKLATTALPSGQITFQLVDELVSNSRELSNFELTDHLLAKNRRRAWQVLKKILDDGAEPLMLLGLIASNYHRLALAKEMMARGQSKEDVFRLVSMPPFKREEFLASARRADAQVLAHSLEKIAKTDLAIKSSIGGGGVSGARLQIEMLVLELSR